jgi:hypothetical protein
MHCDPSRLAGTSRKKKSRDVALNTSANGSNKKHASAPKKKSDAKLPRRKFKKLSRP